MLIVLEEGTSWANKAELYIGLIKDSVLKYMKDSNYPLNFLILLCLTTNTHQQFDRKVHV